MLASSVSEALSCIRKVWISSHSTSERPAFALSNPVACAFRLACSLASRNVTNEDSDLKLGRVCLFISISLQKQFDRSTKLRILACQQTLGGVIAKKFLKTIAAASALSVIAAASALADGHGWKPDGPIKMIIAFAAGGGADKQARLIADDIQTATGWEIIPEQVTGKGGVNALVALKDMPADGSAIALVVTESLGYNAAAAKASGITPDGFTGLTTTAGFQMGIVAKSDKGKASFEDMIAAAKDGNLRFGLMSPKL